MSSGRGVLDVKRSSSGKTNPSKIRSAHTVRVLLALCVFSFIFHLSVTHSCWTLLPPQDHLNDLFRPSLENHSALHALRELSTHRFVPGHGSSLLISRHAFGHVLRVSGRFTARREPSHPERLRLSHQKDVVRDETKQL